MNAIVVRSNSRTHLHMKRSFLLILFILVVANSWAQLGLKVVNLRPTGQFGQVMERTYSAQVMYIDDFEETMRARFFLAYYKLKPRLEQFPVTGYEYRDGIWTVFPGVEIWDKYNLLFLGGGLDWGLLTLLDDKLTLYPGFEIFGGTVSEKYTSDVPGISTKDFTGGHVLAGVGLRAGADYVLTDGLAMFAEYTTSTYFVAETGRFTYNDIGIGARFTF
jgi:hypothetical protein